MLVDPTEHFRRQVGPIEHTDLAEVPAEIRNIGWTLGNDCPYRCTHCYSMSARQKGMDFTPAIVDQLAGVGVETVNLGGNEPLFTNGPDPSATLLPRIIHGLADAGILVGLTTSGITLTHLHRDHKDAFDRLNDVDVSLDSPYPDEHNNNRGAKLYKHALGALRLCQDAAIPHSVIMCAMNWNFTPDRVSLRLAAAYLGTRVEVVIDRPHGSRHPVHGFRYDTNYGYLPGTRAPDGDELDAYYLGTPQPLSRAEGTCVAVIHRLTDDDDKLVVVPTATTPPTPRSSPPSPFPGNPRPTPTPPHQPRNRDRARHLTRPGSPPRLTRSPNMTLSYMSRHESLRAGACVSFPATAASTARAAVQMARNS